MADCLSLFVLCRNVLAVSAALSVLLALWVRWRHADRAAAAGFCVGSCAVLLAAAGVAAAAMVDFSGVFVLFHRLSFSNDLWMMDPRTDLLIRLMPLDFFVRYVTIIACVWIGAMLAMIGVSAALWAKKQRK